MGTIRVTVVVQGLALWIPRRRAWQVLFPKATAGNEQHIPKLTITKPGNPSEPMDLSGKCVAVENVAGEPLPRQSLSWLQHLSGSASQTLRKPACTEKEGVVTELHLPGRLLLPIDPTFVGPIHDPETGVVDHYWGYGSRIEFEAADGAAHLVIRAIGETGGDVHPIPLSSESGKLTLHIMNRTANEHAGQLRGTQSGESLQELRDLFAVVGNAQRQPPQYCGEDLVPAIPPGNVVRAMFATPYRLCPQGYCPDCPGD